MILLIGLAGAIGSLLRFAMSKLDRGINVVNVIGSFVFGMLASSVPIWHPNATSVLLTGFLGGFTTFSSAMQQTAELWKTSRRSAAINAIGPLALSVTAVWLGLKIGYNV